MKKLIKQIQSSTMVNKLPSFWSLSFRNPNLRFLEQ